MRYNGAEPDRRVASRLEQYAAHTFLAPDCADDTLAASTTYWIVFSDVDHSEYEIGNSFGLNVKDYYGSGWNIINEVAKRGASNDWALDQGVLRVGFWASEN